MIIHLDRAALLRISDGIDAEIFHDLCDD